MKTVIGLVGEKAGGKGTFTEILKSLLPNKKIAYAKFSDILTDSLKLWGLELTRENYQKLSIAMRNTFGDGTLTQAIQNRIKTMDADIVILDGIRWESDLKLLRSFPANLLVYVTASAELRHTRSQKRGEKAGEENATFEQFMKEEEAETERAIPKIGMSADCTIVNDEEMPQLEQKVRKFCYVFLP
ncbi:MAG: hypothetical protein Q8P76_02945 [bacterium]|nr:hypothetical protein [bacterium]